MSPKRKSRSNAAASALLQRQESRLFCESALCTGAAFRCQAKTNQVGSTLIRFIPFGRHGRHERPALPYLAYRSAFFVANPTRLSIANSRYAAVELYDSILPDNVLVDVLVRGMVDPAQIREAVNASAWFVTGDEAAWRTVWHAFERNDEDVAKAAKKLAKDFHDRAYSRSGEVLHVFGEMLWLAEIDASEWSTERTVTACRTYVDDLRKDGRLSARGPNSLSESCYRAQPR
jgi:hypothetical protein